MKSKCGKEFKELLFSSSLFMMSGVLLTGCGASTTATSASSAGGVKLSLSVARTASSTALLMDPDEFGGAGTSLKTNFTSPSPHRYSAVPAGNSVYAFSTGLASLKLFITSIKLCSDAAKTPTGVPNGCSGSSLTLYQKSAPDAITNATTNLASAITTAYATTSGYIDLMDATSRSQLNQTVALPTTAQSYTYAVVEWAPIAKVTATMVNPADGVTPALYTKTTAACTTCVVNGQTVTTGQATSSMTTAPAQEAAFQISGSGVLKFQNPLVISAADIASGATYNLNLPLNPDGLVQGVMATGATNYPPVMDGTSVGAPGVGSNTMNLINFQLAGIFYKSTDTIMQESYTATVNAGNNNGTYLLRLEYYFLKSDTTKSIYGVNVAMLPTAATATYLIGFGQPFGVTTNTDSSINLLDYQASALVSNFKRITTVGGTTTAQLACNTVTMNCTAGTPVSATFTLNTLGAL